MRGRRLGWKTPESLHAEMLPSACQLTGAATPNRFDPYWDSLWVRGSQAVWTTAETERRRAEFFGRQAPKWLMTEEEGLRRLTTNRGRAERHAVWSVLHAYRTVTAEQLAAFTGTLKHLDPRRGPIAASFSADLIDHGFFPVPLNRSAGERRDVLYRPAPTDVFDQVIAPTLTGPEWLNITGGQPWSGSGQYDRHNVLATELALRAAEYLPVGAVLGETFSSVDLLLGSGLGRPLRKPDNRRADGVIVRNDGLRIAYEITASASRGLERKMRRWCEAIAQRPLETSGLIVVFVAAPHSDLQNQKNTLNALRDTLASVLKNFPGTGTDSPAARIGIAAWADWFPGAHLLSELFFNLEADFATGIGSAASRWVPRGLLDEQPFEPWKDFHVTEVIRNAPLLGATPHFMREPGRDYTDLIGTPMDRAGGLPVPHPAPARPDRAKGRALGEGVGAAADTGLPRRLRIIG